MLWLKRILQGLAILVLALVLFLAFALRPYSIPEKSLYSFSLEQIRKMALSQKGDLPTEIRTISGFSFKFPGAIVGTGWELRGVPMEGWTFQIVYPKTTVIVDAAMSREKIAKDMSLATFQEKAYQELQQAMRRASLVLVTHEHLDHANGIAESPYLKELAPKVRLTAEQIGSSQFLQAGFTEESKKLFQPLRYDKLHALAPGIVLIKAPGHTPGSQMVYVRLQQGTELLLVGDVAWHEKNILLPRAHPRLIHWLIQEDGVALTHQLRFLHDLHRNHPKLHLVVSHDHEQVHKFIKQGLLRQGFVTQSF